MGDPDYDEKDVPPFAPAPDREGELVKRLLECEGDIVDGQFTLDPLCKRAAARISALEQEVKDLEKQLEWYTDSAPHMMRTPDDKR